MHSYEQLADGTWIPQHDADLKQVKANGYSASVTSKLAIIANTGLDQWKMSETIKCVEQNPRMNNEHDEVYHAKINELVWQPRTRWDGVVFASNDFGTHIHNELDQWNKDRTYQFAPEWEMYCRGWPSVYDTYCAETWGAEVVIGCHKLLIAGTADLIGIDHEGKYILMDFKARPHSTRKQKPTRDKDCQQLAIEADILRRQKGLDYMPDCYSILICTDTGEYYVHKWTEYMVKKHLQIALSANLLYNVKNGFQTLEEALRVTAEVISE